MTAILADPAATELNGRRRAVVVVGGGQAGLAISWHLCRRGIDHVVLERDRVGHEWRDARWDTFCLVTPNWQCRLPGFPYPGDDPDGFMVRDDIVRYLEDYAASFGPPLVEGVTVTALAREAGGGFTLSTLTAAGDVAELRADQVVVATGGYHRPRLPRLAERLPDHLTQLHSSTYTGPDALPAGEVLVVGSGQSGAQIAEDLHLAGRTVHLAVGSAPRVARFYRGRDVVAWLDEMGYYDIPVSEHPLGDGVRRNTNHYVTGRDGGHDIDFRVFATEGMSLYGRLVGVDGDRLSFAGDLTRNLDRADEVSESIKNSIDAYITANGLDAPAEARTPPVWTPPPGLPRELTLGSAVSTVVWCSGFDPDYRWIDVPVFTGRGYPTHTRGVTTQPGLYFVGLPWLYTWGSGRFSGVARDAEHLATVIASRAGGDLAGAGARGLNALALGS